MKSLRNLVRQDFSLFFAAPALIWQIAFLYVPLLSIWIMSFSDYALTGNLLTGWTFAHYLDIANNIYLKIILNSFGLAVVTSCLCFVIAFPVAYFIAMKVVRWRTILLFSLILPSWTNFIVQIYAWFFLLERGGLFSQVLYHLGITKSHPHLLNTFFSTIVGMVYCYLPFMIFPIYTVLEKMEKPLLEASADLGATRFQTFTRVIFPLSLPGVLTGFLLVFVPAYGEFAIPLLLGGSRNVFWGYVIVEKFLVSRDWASGFALASVGIVFLLSIICVFYIFWLMVRLLFRFFRTWRFKKPAIE